MFTEAEIRAACEDFGLLDIDRDSVIEQLKENRQRESELPGPIQARVDHLNEMLADSGFHYTVHTWQPPKPEAHETELERWIRENQLDDCPFCPENWPNLYMMALPIHIGP